MRLTFYRKAVFDTRHGNLFRIYIMNLFYDNKIIWAVLVHVAEDKLLRRLDVTYVVCARVTLQGRSDVAPCTSGFLLVVYVAVTYQI